MSKHVVVVASGETERRALPHLVHHLRELEVIVDGVRIPPGNSALNPRMAENLIRATWYEKGDSPPDKFVVLVDVDRSSPADVLAPFESLAARLGEVGAPIRYAFAQRHLEAWYFADAGNLRAYLGRAPGHVDTSRPDEIENPKLVLKHLLHHELYTARISGEIARSLDPATIAQRSPSFKGFMDAVMNGPPV